MTLVAGLKRNTTCIPMAAYTGSCSGTNDGTLPTSSAQAGSETRASLNLSRGRNLPKGGITKCSGVGAASGGSRITSESLSPLLSSLATLITCATRRAGQVDKVGRKLSSLLSHRIPFHPTHGSTVHPHRSRLRLARRLLCSVALPFGDDHPRLTGHPCLL